MPIAKRTTPTKPLPKALGITCGIGSMLGAARQAGFEIVGNCEWRKYYYKKDPKGRNTFLTNFPGAWMVPDYPQDSKEVLERIGKVDVIYGHPECGSFSALNFSNKNYKEHQQGCADIPMFLNAVATVKPRYFVMDDLPRSFIGLPMSEYHKILPEYDLFPEWVSNYHYGNIQLNRKRMFMIGSLKTEKWAFIPNEEEHHLTVQGLIEDLLESNLSNNEPHTTDAPCGKIADYFYYGSRGTWADFQKVMSERPEGPPIDYEAKDGSRKVRCGTAKVRWKGHGFVLDGGSVCTHPIRNLPLSIRERARIQGFPDDFIFYGVKTDERGYWNHDKNNEMVKQTGKAMPWEFNRYVGELILGKIESPSNTRMIKSNEFVDQAKTWFCQEVGYSDQKKACNSCWMKTTCRLERFSGDRTNDPISVPKESGTPQKLNKTPRKPLPTLSPRVLPGTVFGPL